MTSNKNTLYYNYIDKWVWLPFLLVSLIAIVFIIKGCKTIPTPNLCGEIEINISNENYMMKDGSYILDLKETVSFNYKYKRNDSDIEEKYRYWRFGDGDSLYTINEAKHRYSKAGYYEVSVDGCEGLKKLVIVNNKPDDPPKDDTIAINTVSQIKAKFNIPNSIVVGKTLKFEDKTKGEITSRAWYVNNRFVSNEKSYSHTFEIAGQYTISLVVNEDSGSEKRSTIRVTPLGESPPPPPTPAIKIVAKNQPTSYTLTGDGNDRILYTFKIKNAGNTIISNIEITGIEEGIRQLDIGEESKMYEYPLSIRPIDINNGSVQSLGITVTGRANNGREVIYTWDTKEVPIVINSRPSVNPEIKITIDSPDRFEYREIGDTIKYNINVKYTGGTMLRDISIEVPSSLECTNCQVGILNNGESYQAMASYTIRQKDVDINGNGEISKKRVTVKTNIAEVRDSELTEIVILKKESAPRCPTISKEEYADKLKKYVSDSKESPEKTSEITNLVMREFLSFATITGNSFDHVIIKYKKFDLSQTYIKGSFSDLYNALHAHNNLKHIIIEEMKINSENQCIQSLKLKYGRKIF